MTRAMLSAVMALMLMGPIRQAGAEGAIALGLPDDVAREGVAVGWAVRMPRERAESTALEKCREVTSAPPSTRDLCRVVQTFAGACLAVAIDPGDGTPGFGWAVAATKAEADDAAMRACVQTAGPARQGFCQIGASDCDRR